jgi:hypothetical protein
MISKWGSLKLQVAVVCVFACLDEVQDCRAGDNWLVHGS